MTAVMRRRILLGLEQTPAGVANLYAAASASIACLQSATQASMAS